eukprot:7700426-Ditylum_brightwellii.AAC.1
MSDNILISPSRKKLELVMQWSCKRKEYQQRRATAMWSVDMVPLWLQMRALKASMLCKAMNKFGFKCVVTGKGDIIWLMKDTVKSPS